MCACVCVRARVCVCVYLSVHVQITLGVFTVVLYYPTLDSRSHVLYVFFPLEAESSAVSTIVVRGSTDNVIDDIERSLDDGINTFKALTKVF